MRALRPALLLVALALAGCFQVSSVLTVRADGSATLRDRVVLTGLSAAVADEEGVDKDELRRRATGLGEGVRLVGVEDGGEGYVAVYAVPDVAALRYTLPTPFFGGEDGTDGGAPDLTFAFAPGAPTTLQIVVPEEADDGAAAPPQAKAPERDVDEVRQALRRMRTVLGDARVEVRVEVEGRVVGSDAAFRDGPAVTVMDLVFRDLLDELEASPEMMTGERPSAAEVRALLEGREGIRLQEPGTVTVRFE